MLKIARIAIKKNAAFSDCIVVFGVKPYIVAKIIEAQKYMNDNNFINEINKYQKYGINHNNFIKKANQQYKEIMKRIGKVLIKCKQDFISEGLHCGIDYFNFQTSFFRRKL